MSRRPLFIAVGIAAVAILGGAAYYAMQTLSPRAYVPAESALPALADIPEAAPAPERPAPAIAQPTLLPPKALSVSAPAAGVRPATDAERAAYAAAAPRIADPALIPKGLIGIAAYSYGKKDILIAELPSALVPGSIWKYDPSVRVLTTLVDAENGAMLTRSANGAFTLSSRTEDNGSISLTYEKTAKKERRPLRFATLPPKCFLEGDRAILYCGVPISLPARAVMPDDYLKRKFYTDDRIVMIDLENIRVTELPTGTDLPLDIYEPRAIAGTLLFTNRLDGALYALPLPAQRKTPAVTAGASR